MIRKALKKASRILWLLPGFLLWASFPPMGEMADSLFALAPLLWFARRAEPGKSARRWFVNGLVFWVATLSWMPAIVKNGGPWPLVVLGWGALAAYCAAYFAAFGYLSAKVWSSVRDRGYIWRLAALIVVEPLLWGGLELVRSRLFGGFAWNQLGVVPAVGGFGAPAALGGVYLLSMVVVLINGTVASIAERVLDPSRRHWSRSVETLLPFALIFGLYSLANATSTVRDETESFGDSMPVAMVQRNFPCVFNPAREEESPAKIYAGLLGNVAPLKPRLVVLPESAYCEAGRFGTYDAAIFSKWVCELAGAKAVLGGGTRNDGDKEFNSAAITDVSGRCQIYDKVHLVPFGEFIPGDKIFTSLQKLAPVGSCTAGELKTLDFDGVKLGVAICYEDTDSAQIRRLAAMGARILVFITNDSWFSHSDEAEQHAWQSVARSMETGLPVIRVGNSGVTGTITPWGRATWLIDDEGRPLVDDSGTMFDRVPYCPERKSLTPYVLVGDTPLFVAFLVLLAAIFLPQGLFRRRAFRLSTLACVLFAAVPPASADCLDELMPRPRQVFRSPSGKVEPPNGPGSYQLAVKDGKPSFSGDAEGRHYARMTYAQLVKLAGAERVPDCVINDWPEFKYRGLMLDCGRNYQSVESVKDVISMLAAYKFNVFHWHLTDNYGWRLESKIHPELQNASAFSRQIGKYYTQAEFKDVLAYAKRRGVTVIPELDMPGHTLAFRKATGIDDLSCEKAKIMLGELIDELCTLAPAHDMPIIHLGTDEARERGEKVPQSHLDYWAGKVTSNGRALMGWSPGLKLPGQSIKQLWMGANDPRGDKTPYIDSQNSYYINHVDPEELLSVAAYQQPCRWGAKSEHLGAIIGVWHDDAIADTEDVVRMNAVYPAIVLLSDNFWRGREKDEPGLYARLPSPDDPRFALAADLERRTLAQRDKVLKGLRHPFPYVAQTAMRWRMTDADGKVLAENIPQATIYPRHFWFPKGAYAPSGDGRVTLEARIVSDRDMDCGAWIGMTGFSRSDGRSRDAPTPRRGQWNKHGATIEINGVAVKPPEWIHPGVSGNPKETPLVDEDYWYREPSRIHLKKGENTVKIVLPKKGGWKWIGTFLPVAGTSDHPREVPGLRYLDTTEFTSDTKE